MAGARDAFPLTRRAAFDGLISVVEKHVDEPGSLILAGSSPPEISIMTHAALLNDDDAARQAWMLLGQGVRHLRDFFTGERGEESTLGYAARAASLRNAPFVASRYLIAPPAIELPAPVAFSHLDANAYVRDISARMLDIAEADVPDSRAVIAASINLTMPGFFTPEGDQRAAPHVLRQAFLDSAEKQGLSHDDALAFRAQMKASLKTLETAYVDACRDFRREIGRENPDAAPPRRVMILS